MTAPAERLFVVGATKAGTTGIHALLASHPDIAMSRVKETHHYCPDLWEALSHINRLDHGAVENIVMREESRHNGIVPAWSDYEMLFGDTGRHRYWGETCPAYLRSMLAAELIAADHKNAKIIAILRDPIERAISHHKMEVRDALVPVDFRETIELERVECGKRIVSRHGILESGLYGEGLARFLRHFPMEQILVLDFETLPDRLALTRKLAEFLDIDAALFPAHQTKLNESVAARNETMNRLLARSGLKELIRRALPVPLIESCKKLYYRRDNAHTVIDRNTADFLVGFYADDVGKLLQILRGRQIPWASTYVQSIRE